MEKLICLEAVDSTNSYLRKSPTLPHGTVVIADGQSSGRGRMGRSFFSLAGKGVYMSELLHPDCPPQKAMSLTPNLAVAVCRAISSVCGVMPEIKWVNDIYLKGKKICGILCESVIENGVVHSVIAGVGVNVSALEEDFPPELRDIAGSLLSQTGKCVERGVLALEIVKETEKMFEVWMNDDKAYLEDYRKLCFVPGHEIRILSPNGEEAAFAEGVSDDFGLIVSDPDRCQSSLRTLRFGEISVRVK